MKLDQILAALPKLTVAERAAVRSAIEHLASPFGGPVSDPTGPLYEAMLRALGVTLPWATFQRSANAKPWRAHAPGTLAFIDSLFPDRGRVARAALYSFMIQLIIDDLKGRAVPISLGTVASNIGRIPALFDREFPGYRQSGMATLVTRAMGVKD